MTIVLDLKYSEGCHHLPDFLRKKRIMKKLKFLAVSIGLIYIWFGMLKFFPGLSSAEDLASNTIEKLTFGLITPKVGTVLLAILEVLIGAGLIFQFKMNWVVPFALGHMLFTFTPLFFFPDLSFTHAPYGFTIVGQYIMKNIVIIMALIMLIPAKESKLPKSINA